jgi:hypothetical protein
VHTAAGQRSLVRLGAGGGQAEQKRSEQALRLTSFHNLCNLLAIRLWQMILATSVLCCVKAQNGAMLPTSDKKAYDKCVPSCRSSSTIKCK